MARSSVVVGCVLALACGGRTADGDLAPEGSGGLAAHGGSRAASGTDTGGTKPARGGAPAGGSSGGVATGGISTGGISTGGISTGGTSTGGISTGGVITSDGGVSSGGVPATGSTSGAVSSFWGNALAECRSYSRKQGNVTCSAGCLVDDASCDQIYSWLREFCLTSVACSEKHCLQCEGAACDGLCDCVPTCEVVGKEFCREGWVNYVECRNEVCAGCDQGP